MTRFGLARAHAYGLRFVSLAAERRALCARVYRDAKRSGGVSDLGNRRVRRA